MNSVAEEMLKHLGNDDADHLLEKAHFQIPSYIKLLGTENHELLDSIELEAKQYHHILKTALESQQGTLTPPHLNPLAQHQIDKILEDLGFG